MGFENNQWEKPTSSLSCYQKKEQQSNNFIFEILNKTLTLSEIKQQVQNLYKRTDIPFLKKIIVKKDNNFLIFERK